MAGVVVAGEDTGDGYYRRWRRRVRPSLAPDSGGTRPTYSAGPSLAGTWLATGPAPRTTGLLSAIVQLERRFEEEIVHLHVDRIVDSHADDPADLLGQRERIPGDRRTRGRRGGDRTVHHVRHGGRRHLHVERVHRLAARVRLPDGVVQRLVDLVDLVALPVPDQESTVLRDREIHVRRRGAIHVSATNEQPVVGGLVGRLQRRERRPDAVNRLDRVSGIPDDCARAAGKVEALFRRHDLEGRAGR